MKRFSEQFHKKSQTVKLNKAEQADLRSRVVSYMEYHPLPAEMKLTSAAKTKKASAQPIMREPFAIYNVPFAQLFKFGSMFAFIMVMVVPFVAERAIPGDTLYAVKVNFNEEVRSTLAWSPYQKVEWETVRLNRRIAEAKLLQKEGLLTDVVEAEVAAAVKYHAENAKAEIETLRASDADEAAIASIELDANLTLQAQSFDSVLGDEAAGSTGTDLIADAIDASLVKQLSNATTSLPALPKLIARVEQNTTRVRELEKTLIGQVGSEVMSDVTRRIVDLERVAAEAFNLPEEEVKKAQTLLVDVISRAQTLVVYMTELDVRETVAINTAVPVVLTTDEININRTEIMSQIDTYISQINNSEVEEEALLEKLAVAAQQMEDIKAELQDVDVYETYLARSADALALGHDAVILIEQSGVSVSNQIPAVGVASSTESIATSTATSTEEIAEPSEEETPVMETGDIEIVASTTDQIIEPVVPTSTAPTTEEVDVVDDISSSSTQTQSELDEEI